jgi:hypothetical protein
MVFDRIWVCVSREQVSPVLTWFVVALHQVLNEMNKMKRLFVLFPYLSLLRPTVSCR